MIETAKREREKVSWEMKGEGREKCFRPALGSF